jgi:hypothetical protein
MERLALKGQLALKAFKGPRELKAFKALRVIHFGRKVAEIFTLPQPAIMLA